MGGRGGTGIFVPKVIFEIFQRAPERNLQSFFLLLYKKRSTRNNEVCLICDQCKSSMGRTISRDTQCALS